MRATTLLCSAIALAASLAGCGLLDGTSCEDNRIQAELGSGTYGLADAAAEAEGNRRFPHDGRDVSVEVDRAAGVLRATWFDDEGRQVTETWRMEPL